MPRRIDIELTSCRDDGTWTWRAAGAKQPKGVLQATILYEDARVGDVVRAEADFEIDGITVVLVHAPREARKGPDRIEVIGSGRSDSDLVTTSLVPKSDRPRRDDDRRPRRDGAGGPRREGGDRGPRREGAGGPRREGAGALRGDRADTRRGAGAGAGGRPPRAEGAGRPDRERGPRPDGRGRPARPADAEEAKPKPKRLNPASVHRNAVLESLSPEQRPVAEQVLRGGLPAVRQAIEEQNKAARAAGQPEMPAAGMLAMAEELLPRLKSAEWRDRADAAAAVADEIALRDLRSVVTGADAAARDDESRTLASTLRQALDRRVTAQRESWLTDVTSSLDEGRLVRALRVASRPPDPATRVPAELAIKLSEAASAAMTPEISSDRWAALLEAVAASPVRRNVKPVGLPLEPGDALLNLARASAGSVPALAGLLGIEIPPPPGPGRGSKPQNRGGGRPPMPNRGPRPIPPKPEPRPAATAHGAAVSDPTVPAAAAEVAEPEVASAAPQAVAAPPEAAVAPGPVPTGAAPAEPAPAATPAEPAAEAPLPTVEAAPDVAPTDPIVDAAPPPAASDTPPAPAPTPPAEAPLLPQAEGPMSAPDAHDTGAGASAPADAPA